MRWSPWLLNIAGPGLRRRGSSRPSASVSTPTPICEQLLLDRGDAVALLHPQLGGVADLGDPVGERGRHREHRDLVDHPLVGLAIVVRASGAASTPSAPTGSPSRSPVGSASMRRAHAPEHVDEADAASGSGTRPRSRAREPGVIARRHREERRRRRVARHVELERPSARPPRRRSRAVVDPCDGAPSAPEHALGVVAARARARRPRSCRRPGGPARSTRRLHLRARDRRGRSGDAGEAAAPDHERRQRAAVRAPSTRAPSARSGSSDACHRPRLRASSSPLSTVRNGPAREQAGEHAHRRARVAAVDHCVRARAVRRRRCRARRTVDASESFTRTPSCSSAPRCAARRRRRRGRESGAAVGEGRDSRARWRSPCPPARAPCLGAGAVPRW